MGAISLRNEGLEKPRFEVGDKVEAFCEHENRRGERVRGWVQGVVVQVDRKMVAVQFTIPVYLTNGWMVPDKILWFPLDSPHLRPVTKRGRRQ